MRNKPQDLPGTFYQRNDRWWWSVRLPNTPKRDFYPLIPDGQKYATTDFQQAQAIALRIWLKAETPETPVAASTGKFDGSFVTFRTRVLQTAETNHGKGSNAYVRSDHATRWCLSDADRPTGFPQTIHDIRPSHLEALMRHQAKEGLSRTTINQRMQLLVNKLFRYAARDGLISQEQYGMLTLYEPLRAGVSEAKEPKVIHSVDAKIVDVTMWFAPPTIRDMVEFQALTGARSGELCRMSWSQIDATRDVWFYVPSEHKTKHRGKIRVIAIGPKGQKILERYKDRPADAPIFSAKQATKERLEKRREKAKFRKKEEDLIGVDRYSDRYDSHGYRQAIDYAIEAARKGGHEIPDWHPHQLRHQKATGTYLMLGHEQASAALGHSDNGVTMIYVDRDAQLATQMKIAAEVARKVG